MKIHYHETGFFRYVYDTEQGVLDGIKDYMKDMPAYHPKFFRVAEPKDPRFPSQDLYYLLPFNQKQMYDFDEILARLVDGSEHMEYRPGYGPEVYTGLVKIDGFLIGVIGNRQGFLGEHYPEYAPYPGIGGKLYRQGLIKMNELSCTAAATACPSSGSRTRPASTWATSRKRPSSSAWARP